MEKERKKGKGRVVEEIPEAGPSKPQKQRASEAEEGPSAKKHKVSDNSLWLILLTVPQFDLAEHWNELLWSYLASPAYSMTGPVLTSPGKRSKKNLNV